jgi:hypothetical protein
LSDIWWKRADYVWLVIAFVGVLTASSRSSHAFAEIKVELQGPVTYFAFETLRHDIDLGASPGSEGCAPRIRSPFSPPDFDDIRKAQQLLCAEFTRLKREVLTSPAQGEMKFVPLDQLNFHPISESAELHKYEQDELKRLKMDAEKYKQEQRLYSQAVEEVKATQSPMLVELDFGIGPMILGIAISIRFTKTLGEVSNQKKKRGACS